MLDALFGGNVAGGPLRMSIRLTCIGLLTITAAAPAQPQPPTERPVGQPGGQPAQDPERPPPFQPLRYDEDYSYLRDPAKRTGQLLALEPIKYIPLNRTGDWYLSIGGEVRQRYEFYQNRFFGLMDEGEDGYLLQRYVLHGDLQLDPSFRAFVQPRVALVSFQDGPIVPANEDGIDIQQGFFDLRSGPPRDHPALTLRLGRQEMLYGTERLISVREVTNVRRAFDAVRVLTRFGDWQVDGFVSHPVENEPETFDAWFRGQTNFWGIYGTGPAWQAAGLELDLYYLGLERPDAAFEQGTARELRHTIGTRPSGRLGPVDYNFEGMFQWGKFGSGHILAWAVASDTGYTFEALPLSPRISLRSNVASGDLDPNDDDLGTFNPLFPRGNYFGESAIVGPMNLFDVQPILRLRFAVGLLLEGRWGFFWRYSTSDGFYSNALNLVQAADGSDSRFIGSELSFAFEGKLRRNVSTRASYSHFFTGSFLEDTGPARDVNFASLTATFQF